MLVDLMFLIRHWLLMVLPFALWGTAMAAMAPLDVVPQGSLILFPLQFAASDGTTAELQNLLLHNENLLFCII